MTNHQFFWKGILVLTLQEHDNMDDVYLGNNSTLNPEAGVPAHSWDYNKDGVIDVVTIGPSKAGKEYLFGRYQDGVFGLAPTDKTLAALWKHLRQNKSEEAGADQPASDSDSKPENRKISKPVSEVAPR